MAKFFTNFEGLAEGVDAPNFTRVEPAGGGNTSSISQLVIYNDPTTLNGKLARVVDGGSVSTTFSWDLVTPTFSGELGGRCRRNLSYDTEVHLAMLNNNSRLEGVHLILRGSNLWIQQRQAPNTTVVNTNTIASVSLSGLTNATWFCYRFRVIDGVAYAKLWAGLPEDEPTEWTLQVTVPVVAYYEPLAGLCGIGNRRISRVAEWDFVSFADDGDPAPMAPIPTGPNTPTNLGATNILANSVRFTWEQG